MNWTEAEQAELARQYERIGYVQGERWPAPPPDWTPARVLEWMRVIPAGAGREGWIAALKSAAEPPGGAPPPGT